MKCGRLILLEPIGFVQACTGMTLPLLILLNSKDYAVVIIALHVVMI